MDSKSNNSARRTKTKEKSKNVQEEMKNELRAIGLYEDGMSERDMERFLKTVNDSKQTAMQNMEQSAQSNLYDAPLSQLPPYSHNENHLPPSSSSSLSSVSNTAAIADSAASESTPFSYNKLANKMSPGDDEKTPLIQDDYNNWQSHRSRFDASPSTERKHTSTSARNTSFQEPSKLDYPPLNQLESWRINPLDSKTLDNDMPLRRRKSSNSVARPKFQYVNDVPVIPADMRAKQRAILNKVAELWIKQQSNLKPRIDEVHWGTPIKVGIDNGSLDKYPVKENSMQHNDVPESNSCAGRRGLRSSTKMQLVVPDDEEDDDKFESKRKKSMSFNQKLLKHNNGEILKSRKTSPNLEKNSHQSTLHKFVDDDFISKTPESHRGRKSATPEYPETPDKKILPTKKSNRYDVLVEIHEEPDTTKRNNEHEPMKPTRKQDRSLNDEEIEAQLITDDEEEDAEEKVIPPSPPTEAPLSKRLKLGYSLLQSNRQKEENEKRKVEEEQRLAAEKETHEKEVRARQRLEMNSARSKQREAEEKRKREKEERYRNNLQRSQRWIRTELESDELARDKVYWNMNNRAAETARVSPVVQRRTEEQDIDQVERIQCPICGKEFRIDQVEAHAGSCVDYSIHEDQDESSRSNETTLLKCDLCQFTTPDTDDYARHMKHECEGLNIRVPDEQQNNSRLSAMPKPSLRKRKR